MPTLCSLSRRERARVRTDLGGPTNRQGESRPLPPGEGIGTIPRPLLDQPQMAPVAFGRAGVGSVPAVAVGSQRLVGGEGGGRRVGGRGPGFRRTPAAALRRVATRVL